MQLVKRLAMAMGGIVLALGVAIGYFRFAAQQRLAKTFRIPVHSIAQPFPLDSDEIAALPEARRAPEALAALARERALERAKHYLESRAGCSDCHGADFGGKVILDNPVMGKWIAPNITRGGVTRDYRIEDWDRIVRHGVLRSGLPALMPAGDFSHFSDQELSDIALYIQSLPAVSRVMPRSQLGPMYSLLIATGRIPVSAEVIDHGAVRPALPPALTLTPELGEHLAQTCKGCHGSGLSGGSIQGGDPAWPPARNLTFDDSGLARWSVDDFRKAMKQGIRPDGSRLSSVMPTQFTSQLTAEEVDSIYLYLKNVPKRPQGSH